MRQLYLLRHAKSSWKYTHLKDFDRPLKERGKRNITGIREYAAENIELPELIISSEASRAMATAILFAEGIDYPIEKIYFTKRLYHSTPQVMLEILGEQAEDLQRIMLIGHNPGMTDLANFLQPEFIENIPTSGLAIIRCKGNWNELKLHNNKLVQLITPKSIT